MTVNQANIWSALARFDVGTVFIEELGWDHVRESPMMMTVDGIQTTLTSIAQKRGLRVIQCTMADGSLPDLAIRLKIDREVAKFSRERLLVFVDGAKTRQVWLWVKQEAGRRQPRSFVWHKTQTNDELVQRLSRLNIDLAEESALTIAEIAQRTKSAFDVEKVTKRFYDRFQKEHDTFLKAIEGMKEQDNLDWYTSLMLNRLMFLYFIQHKGFLNNDQQYLRAKLTQIRAGYGAGVSDFYDFYTKFLCVLFHDGLSKPTHDPDVQRLIGAVPYLNGGLFDVHELERLYPNIRIPDATFERLFDFFDSYQWHLDDRPDKADNEINPDVLGYIFEKYINQKQMGAYYTKEDITEYISKNTIIPAIFERAANSRASISSFAPDGWVWDILRHDPDHYFYDAVKHGVTLDIPAEIAAGIDDVSQRTGWNKPAPSQFGLPTETWREYIARRQRYEALKADVSTGKLNSTNDLITHNIDIVAFAHDVINMCDHAPTLRNIYHALETLSVLDPTCGSGAFLFAALNILEPLYERCLEQMETLLQTDIDTASRGTFNDVLDRVNDRRRHPNRAYFILKTIILQNLYGVDIMEEAVEICKLRLFLKLVAQAKTLREVEPLPDIDFNIRAGNTLVGYAKYADVAAMLDSKMDLTNSKATILQRAEATSTAYKAFRDAQTDYTVEPSDTAMRKAKLRAELEALNAELDQHLAHEYGVDTSKPTDLAAWHTSHKPLHWFVEFYAIIEDCGGFDVIIGNPPYVEYSKVKNDYTLRGYDTLSSGNLYAMTSERCLRISTSVGQIGLIVPISATGTDRTQTLQKLFHSLDRRWYSVFDVFPSRLFEGAAQRLSILLMKKKDKQKSLHITKYYRWYQQERDHLIHNINYAINDFEKIGWTPRISSILEISILNKVYQQKSLSLIVRKNGNNAIYVHRIINNFIKAVDFAPYFKDAWGNISTSDDFKRLYVDDNLRFIIISLLNSSLFFWYWRCHGDGFHCGYKDIGKFPFDPKFLSSDNQEKLSKLGRILSTDLNKNSDRRTRNQQSTGTVELQTFYVGKSKPIIDEIDRVLAQHYGFTDEELDFIINYDIKYRMGKSEE